jgi:hypothetical protein
MSDPFDSSDFQRDNQYNDDPFGEQLASPKQDHEEVTTEEEQEDILVSSNPQDDAFEGMPAQQYVPVEPVDTPLSQWEAKRADVLAQRRAEASKAKEQLVVKGREDVDKFYKDRDAAIQKNLNKNRADEKEGKVELESVMQNGTMWEKVARMVDLTPNAAKTYKRGDLVRMRTLLVQLKNDKKN